MVSVPWKSIITKEKQFRIDSAFQYYTLTNFKLVNKDTEQLEPLDSIYKKKKKLYLEGTLVHPSDASKNLKHVIIDSLSSYSYDHGTGELFYGIWIQTKDEYWFLLKETAKEYYTTFEEDFKKGWIFIMFVLLIHRKPDSQMSIIDSYWKELGEKKITPEDVVVHYDYLVEKLQEALPKSYKEFKLFTLVTNFVHSKMNTVDSSPINSDISMESVTSGEEEEEEEEELAYCSFCEGKVTENTVQLTLECQSCDKQICYRCAKENHYHFDFLWGVGFKCFECMKTEHDIDETRYKIKMNPMQYDVVYKATIPDLKSSSSNADTSSIRPKRTMLQLEEEYVELPTQKIRRPRKKTKVTSSTSTADPLELIQIQRPKSIEKLKTTLRDSLLFQQNSAYAEQIEEEVYNSQSTNYQGYMERVRNLITLLKQKDFIDKVIAKRYSPKELATKDLNDLQEKTIESIRPLQVEINGYETDLHPCKKCGGTRVIVQQVAINRFNYKCLNCENLWVEG